MTAMTLEGFEQVVSRTAQVTEPYISHEGRLSFTAAFQRVMKVIITEDHANVFYNPNKQTLAVQFLPQPERASYAICRHGSSTGDTRGQGMDACYMTLKSLGAKYRFTFAAGSVPVLDWQPEKRIMFLDLTNTVNTTGRPARSIGGAPAKALAK